MDEMNPLEHPKRYPGNALWLVGGLVILMLAVGFYFREAKPPVGGGVAVADVTKNPDEFVGRTVTVQGAVESVLGPRAFILEDEGPGGEMLVVTGAPDALPAGTNLEEVGDLRVVGEVRQFDAMKLQGELGVPATDDRLAEVRGKPVLYAFQVVIPPSKLEEHARSDANRD